MVGSKTITAIKTNNSPIHHVKIIKNPYSLRFNKLIDLWYVIYILEYKKQAVLSCL